MSANCAPWLRPASDPEQGTVLTDLFVNILSLLAVPVNGVSLPGLNKLFEVSERLISRGNLSLGQSAPLTSLHGPGGRMNTPIWVTLWTVVVTIAWQNLHLHRRGCLERQRNYASFSFLDHILSILQVKVNYMPIKTLLRRSTHHHRGQRSVCRHE